MKILLIYPYFIEDRIHEEDIRLPPTGLYYVAAVLVAHGYEPEILNWHDKARSPQAMEDALREKGPDVIGFSILNANRWGAVEITRIAKRVNPGVRVVFGGVGATFLWVHLLHHFPEIDYVVLGEGEYTFLSLIRCLEGDGDQEIEKIQGLAFRKKGKIVRTGDPDPIKDLDLLPIPSRYFEYPYLSSSRGCNRDCTFCGSPRFWGKRVRFRSPGHFVKELETLYRKGITFFFFSDDTFTLKKDRVIEICRRIIEGGLRISWNAISRVDHVDKEVLYWMRRAGCIQISYGVESGSEKIRDILNKRIKTEQIKKAFSLTTLYGIMARAYFIYGAPGETWETIQETIGLIHEIRPLSAIFYILDMFPGTRLYETFQKKAGVSEDVWLNRIEGIMHFQTDPHLSEDMILAFGKRLREDFYDHLPGFVEAVQLIDRKDLYEHHADFYSRLGMTFTHGDYSRVDRIEDKDKIAERLFRKSLSYHPDHRAYLGLGILYQKRRAMEDSMHILQEGVGYFPQSEPLHLSLGICHMNMKSYNQAISCLEKFPSSREARIHMARCYQEKGDAKRASALMSGVQDLF